MHQSHKTVRYKSPTCECSSEFHRHTTASTSSRHNQSIEILKQDPALIGCDPTIIVYDLYGCSRTDAGRAYTGFRLNLGLMRNAEQALARLQEFVRFIATKRDGRSPGPGGPTQALHREGIEGIVKLLQEASTRELLME